MISSDGVKAGKKNLPDSIPKSYYFFLIRGICPDPVLSLTGRSSVAMLTHGLC
jgi:hypothetical protein